MHQRGTRRRTRLLPALALAALLLAGCSTDPGVAIDLGSAQEFAVLAGSGITNTGFTQIVGDIGSHPTPAQTGFAGLVTINGTNHFDDSVTAAAKVDLVQAYDEAANRTPTSVVVMDLGGMNLTRGVYKAPSSLALTGTLTLDGEGDPDSVFIFQAGSTLITDSSSRVLLVNGTRSCNVFWQVTSSATLGTDSQFAGSILALTSITLDTRATVDGRVLARNGAVTMDNSTIVADACAGNESPTPTTSIPVFPTGAAIFLATLGALGGSYFILRKRR